MSSPSSAPTPGRLDAIRTYGDPVLRSGTAAVTEFDRHLAQLADRMIAVMHAAGGVGLAANQIGVGKRLFVYDDGEGGGDRVVVNPSLVAQDGELIHSEGCLSVPGLWWDIRRFAQVVLVGQDLDGGELVREATDLEARIFQHEVDHLDGLLLVDRLDEDQRHEARGQLRGLLGS